jgi:hypothetical protein
MMALVYLVLGLLVLGAIYLLVSFGRVYAQQRKLMREFKNNMYRVHGR